jgi:hypothetical protein
MSYIDSALLNDTIKIKDKYSIDIFVESGCQNGDSLNILSNVFNKLYSCDTNDYYIGICKDKFSNSTNIEVIEMDGAKHLEYLYENKKINNDNFILFSDGHNLREHRNT